MRHPVYILHKFKKRNRQRKCSVALWKGRGSFDIPSLTRLKKRPQRLQSSRFERPLLLPFFESKERLRAAFKEWGRTWRSWTRLLNIPGLMEEGITGFCIFKIYIFFLRLESAFLEKRLKSCHRKSMRLVAQKPHIFDWFKFSRFSFLRSLPVIF